MLTNRSTFIRNLVILLDFIIVIGVTAAYYIYYKSPDSPNLVVGVSISYMLLACVAMAVAQTLFSTIVHRHYRSIDKVLRQVSLLVVTYIAMYAMLFEASKWMFNLRMPAPEFTINCSLLIVLLLVVLRVVEYIAIKRIRGFGHNQRLLIFVGDAKTIVKAYDELDLMPYTGLNVLGYYSDTTITTTKLAEDKQLGTIDDLKEWMDKNPESRIADDIYCTELPNNSETVTRLVDYSIRNGIQFNYVPLQLSCFGYCLQPRIEGDLLVFSNVVEPLGTYGHRVLKRSFDIFVSGIILLFILPIVPIVGIIIKLSSPGPVFFKQERTGLNGKNFNILKFRSMHVNADADRLQATKDDPRKFAFGNFMRKTNIDELPQFINVFKGDMSIVGPRPHMLAHTDEYRKKIYEYMLRHMVRPGITGWAQVTGFRGKTPELWQMSGRVERDLWYIQNWSFWLDIRIIMRTAMQFFVHDKNAF